MKTDDCFGRRENVGDMESIEIVPFKGAERLAKGSQKVEEPSPEVVLPFKIWNAGSLPPHSGASRHGLN